MDVTLRDLDPNVVSKEFFSIPLAEQTIEQVNDLMRVLAIHQRPEETEAILRQLEKNTNQDPTTQTEGTPPSSTVDTLVKMSCRVSPHLLPNEQAYLYHISALAETKQAAAAIREMGNMKTRGVPVTQKTYNAVLQACNRGHRPLWAYRVRVWLEDEHD